MALSPTVKLVGGLRYDRFKASYNTVAAASKRAFRKACGAAHRRAVPAQ